jgi:hypothetical protein
VPDLQTKVESLELQLKKALNQIKTLDDVIRNGNHTKSEIRNSSKHKIQWLLKSCEEIRSYDPTKPSGFYLVDPDGIANGDPPVQVFCDMTVGNWNLIIKKIHSIALKMLYICAFGHKTIGRSVRPQIKENGL